MDAKARAQTILQGVKKAGINLIASLPDINCLDLIDALERDTEIIHVPLCREEEGVGICAGARLVGKKPAILMQNAGLLNSCNGLTTTCLQFQIPLLLLIYYAGDIGDRGFATIGSVTEPVLEALGIRIHYVAPAFGFQKNFPFDDNAELERRVSQAWRVCQAFGVSIGFHSGSGKSAENYRLCGTITGSRLEIKTSGRYTYEMGRALASSSNAADRALFNDWYAFTRELAIVSAFSADEQERGMARRFITHALELEQRPSDVFGSHASCTAALAALSPNPEHMFWFEYNFLFVLAAEGRAAKSALGDHTKSGYEQRARFYALSDEGRLGYAKNVAQYLLFLAETTGMAGALACELARSKLGRYRAYSELLRDIAPR